LTQIIGEYEERFEKAGIEAVSEIPEEPVILKADHRYLWRVFDNLMGNIAKYAQPGTRGYISLKKKEEKTIVSFKNTSREPLNITEEELMQRFVRGDRSRNTDGSGLGLSIAESLTTLMGGKFSIAIDGDLFKATVEF
ncbi:MAG: sensor histidine kinase, partial [Lachnospiraceae bacterium]|nr:sensor histidine kinase [Lachnospiraceae bacterium]